MKPTSPVPATPAKPVKSLPPLGPLNPADFALGVEVTEVLGEMPDDLMELFKPKQDDTRNR